MGYKSLLTVHSVSDEIETLAPILEFANSVNAHLDIIILGVLLPPPATVYGTFPGDYWRENNQHVFSDAEDRANRVEKLVQDKNLSTSVISECVDRRSIDRAISPYALCSDLCVLPKLVVRGNAAIEKAFNGILFSTGRPLLLLGDETFDPDSIKSMSVAWDGGAEAASAAQLALPLLKMAKDIHVVMVDPEPLENGGQCGDDLAVYLARHELNVTVDRIPNEVRTVGQALLEHAVDTDAGLLVMGAYGHSRIREWLLGGATQEILNTADLPVLMAH